MACFEPRETKESFGESLDPIDGVAVMLLSSQADATVSAYLTEMLSDVFLHNFDVSNIFNGFFLVHLSRTASSFYFTKFFDFSFYATK